MQTGLAGKGVLVTGASGGTGTAYGGAFAAEVAVHRHRGRERAEAVAEDRGDPAAAILNADLTPGEDVDAPFEGARRALGRVDVCAAVAGVWPAEDIPVWRLPLEHWRATLGQNLTATFSTARGFLREVERKGHSSLILVGSTAGLFGEAGHAHHAAAKPALQGEVLLSLENETSSRPNGCRIGFNSGVARS